MIVNERLYILFLALSLTRCEALGFQAIYVVSDI